MRRKFRSWVWTGVLAATGFLVAGRVWALSTEEDAYLRQLAQDTYASIRYLIEDKTGLPYDSSRFQRPDTSVSNIGLYLATLAGACELGLEKREPATAQARQVLDSLGKMQAWHGFTSSWNDVLTLSPSNLDTFVSVLDTGNLAAGLILTAQAFPALRAQADALLDAIEWSRVYDAGQGLLYGGVNLKTQQCTTNWRLCHLGSDARLAYVIAIGRHAIPVESWSKLSRQEEEKYGLAYYTPGWQGGGLFMQFLSGLFLDEAGTPLGESAGKFAFAQIVHARVLNAPVWGWSACECPDGTYLGFNGLRDEIVTPHASALALGFYPAAVLANFKQLESLGARAPFVRDNESHAFGFHDSVDLNARRADPEFLVLDQSLLFLSVANVLTHGKLREMFVRHPVIASALEQIPDFQVSDEERRDFYTALAAMGADRVILQADPTRIEADAAGNTILVKNLRLINFTNHSYPQTQLNWKIVAADTNQTMLQGTENLQLDKYTEINLPPARLSLSRQETAEEPFYTLEAKLLDPQGSVLTEYLGSLSP